MNWYDDLQTPEPEWGYCPECLDEPMTCKRDYRKQDGWGYWLACDVCGYEYEWIIPHGIDRAGIIPPY